LDFKAGLGFYSGPFFIPAFSWRKPHYYAYAQRFTLTTGMKVNTLFLAMPKKYTKTGAAVKHKEEVPAKSDMPVAKPFLKWAGGKGQLLQKFQELYPTALKENKIRQYYEPFLGSGAVFFDIARKFHIRHAYLYDINEELVLAYQVVQKDVDMLTDILHRCQRNYLALTKEKRAAYFYEQRSSYNSQRFSIDHSKYAASWAQRAAQFIFLNRTCFNGLYRVNSKGEFNTPIGNYENPTICDEQNLKAVSEILQIATIRKAGFAKIKKGLKKDAFVYFDPPYRPISKTASFTAYSKHSFTDKDQTELAELFRFISDKGILAMLSNSDPKNNDPKDNFFDNLYSDFTLTRVPAKRMINSNAGKRGSINEIVVTNYPF
jgi:DNA adenine methylase